MRRSFPLLLFITGAAFIAAAQTVPTPPPDLLPDMAPDFTRFSIPSDPENARWLNRFLWYHLKGRALGLNREPYPHEYLTTADMWVNGTGNPNWPAPQGVVPIQAIHRDNILTMGASIDPEGYIPCRQVPSSAHDDGWPFPLWLQGRTAPDGVSAGWHFNAEAPGLIHDLFMPGMQGQPFFGEKAIAEPWDWGFEGLQSAGIVNNLWRLESTGASPALLTPTTVSIDAYNAPFLQLRWKRTGEPAPGAMPYIEWMRAEDTDFSPERRVYFNPRHRGNMYEDISGMVHSHMTMYRHPLWKGAIKRIRLSLAPGETGVAFDLDSFFTVYDTRHACNNPIYIMSSWQYFRWSGDVDFLRQAMPSIRLALRHHQTVLGGLEFNHIRNTWWGHDGQSGIIVNPDGTKTIRYGHGKGNNYWDILAYGWDDMFATSQYYAATLAVAEFEEAIRRNPGWGVPLGANAFDPAFLRAHAAKVKETMNGEFWDPAKGRFISCVDRSGVAHEYGHTAFNLDAIWYGSASDEHAGAIMSWINGDRVVEGDTSQGEDIYHWRFGPRATTKRNVDWYSFAWSAPETIPWGYQVQDGGSVLGFTFYDLFARVRVLGPDNAWKRLREILQWERDVWADGGYRAYYANDPARGTLQGGGPPGGLGIDQEFMESSLLPAIMPLGFLGLDPRADSLVIAPSLPSACPEMGVTDLLYHGIRMSINATRDRITVTLATAPIEPIRLRLPEGWRIEGQQSSAMPVSVDKAGMLVFQGQGK